MASMLFSCRLEAMFVHCCCTISKAHAFLFPLSSIISAVSSFICLAKYFSVFGATAGALFRFSLALVAFCSLQLLFKLSSSCLMAFVPLSELQPNSHEGVIRVRVCRVWKNRIRSEDPHYSSFDGVLVDALGNSIHFTCDSMDLLFFEASLEPGKIYRISGFYARRNKPTSIIVDFRCMLEFRQQTINIQEDLEPGPYIPTHKFTLVDFSRFLSRKRNHRVLTDVIGHFKGAQPLRSVVCDGGNRLEDKRDVFIENIRGEEMKVTLWADQAKAYNEHAVAQAEQPIIIVFTSTKVTDFGGTSLSSSPATVMFLNPDIPELIPYKTAFAGVESPVHPLPLPSHSTLTPQQIISSPRTTVRQLQMMDPEQNAGKDFFCKAKVTAIKLMQGWYYNSCPRCTFGLKEKDNTACHIHGIPTNGPVPRYKLELIAKDETENAIFMLIGKTAQTFIGQPATKYATGCKEIDDAQLPQEISDKIMGKTLVFQVHFGNPKHNRTRSDILVSGIADPEAIIDLPRLEGPATGSQPLLIEGSLSRTAAANPLAIDLHTPDLVQKKPLAEMTPHAMARTTSNTKRMLVFSPDMSSSQQTSSGELLAAQETDNTTAPLPHEHARKKYKASIGGTSVPAPPDQNEE